MKEFEVDCRESDHINSSLADSTDVSKAKRLACNTSPQRVFQGITPGHAGFVLSPEQRNKLIESHPDSAKVIFHYLIGRELVSGDGLPRRFVIDFGERTILEAKGFAAAYAQVEATVLQDRMDKAEKGKDAQGAKRPHHKQFLERWWRLSWDRADMKAEFRNLNGRYVTGSRTQRWPFVFCFVSTAILPGDKLQTFAFDDDYSFGVIQSLAHSAWYQAKAARLKNEVDYNYSTESIFDTFPWPQKPTSKQVNVVASAALEVLRVRAHAVTGLRGGLRSLYRTLELPGANPLKDAHADLDAAVLGAYGFSQKKDLLAQLLVLNLDVAARIARGELVTGPGVPKEYENASKLVSPYRIEGTEALSAGSSLGKLV